METKVLEISWGSLWRILFFVLLVTVLYLGRQILLGLFLAIIISSGLESAVDFLERRGIPRTLGVILLFLFAILLLIIVIYAIVPLIIVDLNSIFAGFGKSQAASSWGLLFSLKASQSASAIVSKLSQALFSGNVSPLGLFSQTLGSVGLAVAVLVSSFYLSLSRDGVERFIRTVFPDVHEKMAIRIYERSKKKISSWFQAQILSSFIMAVLVWGALTILGVKHAFLLGILAGLLEIVPFVGPIVSGATAVLVALSDSVGLALYTLIVFLAIQQFESHALIPILMKRAVGLHPVIVIIAILMGAQIGGFLGVLIAVPAAAVFQEVLEGWSGNKRAGAAAS